MYKRQGEQPEQEEEEDITDSVQEENDNEEGEYDDIDSILDSGPSSPAQQPEAEPDTEEAVPPPQPEVEEVEVITLDSEGEEEQEEQDQQQQPPEPEPEPEEEEEEQEQQQLPGPGQQGRTRNCGICLGVCLFAWEFTQENSQPILKICNRGRDCVPHEVCWTTWVTTECRLEFEGDLLPSPEIVCTTCGSKTGMVCTGCLCLLYTSPSPRD